MDETVREYLSQVASKPKKPPKPSGKAVLYARFSPRPGEDTCPSAENQLERLREHCAAKELVIRGEFSDEAESGATLDRPKLFLAINSLCSGDVLLVTETSRLSRDPFQAEVIRHEIRRQRGTLRILDQPMEDDQTPMGQLISVIMSAIAQFERGMTLFRTSVGRKLKAKRKGFVGGSAPFGYRIEGDDRKTKRLVPDQEEQETLQMIREFREQGADWGEVAKMLNRRERPSRTGNPWNTNQVMHLHYRTRKSIYNLPPLDSAHGADDS